MKDKKKIDMKENSYWGSSESDIAKMQEKIDKVTENLTKEQVELLKESIKWIVEERMLDKNYDENGDN